MLDIRTNEESIVYREALRLREEVEGKFIEMPRTLKNKTDNLKFRHNTTTQNPSNVFEQNLGPPLSCHDIQKTVLSLRPMRKRV